mmetsp:Transcript_7677/g.16561  ORF Transcript_7677/g.16561 Transcript_7677/m.16561 type:complete len:290 (+) Transcript_7677:266-1135(+)
MTNIRLSRQSQNTAIGIDKRENFQGVRVLDGGISEIILVGRKVGIGAPYIIIIGPAIRFEIAIVSRCISIVILMVAVAVIFVASQIVLAIHPPFRGNHPLIFHYDVRPPDEKGGRIGPILVRDRLGRGDQKLSILALVFLLFHEFLSFSGIARRPPPGPATPLRSRSHPPLTPPVRRRRRRSAFPSVAPASAVGQSAQQGLRKGRQPLPTPALRTGRPTSRAAAGGERRDEGGEDVAAAAVGGVSSSGTSGEGGFPSVGDGGVGGSGVGGQRRHLAVYPLDRRGFSLGM